MRHLQVCNYDVHAHRLRQKRTKIKFESIKCNFVGYDQNSKAYKLIKKETLKLIFQRNVVFNEVMWFSMKKLEVAFKNQKNLPQIEHKQVFPYKFDLDQNIFPKSVSPPKIIHLEKQRNSSCQLFVDLPLFARISRRHVNTPKVATRRSSRIAKAPQRLVHFSCIVAIDETLMREEVLIR